MAERPLYTLYKNLKAQNYDVPDDYNKFESALTREGKGGADNRHAIYENLKAQNFDVPSTYERFYSALFEPRSKTSSRAKGGSVPMSAADRARFSARTAAILSSANNAVRQAKRNIQTKLGQAKKFNGGRVTLRLKNPLQNQNVQKNEFNYNSTTGKTGTYTTTDGVEFDNEYDASQYQNQLDKYGEEWNNAVDMGIVPSELDKADPDLSDTDVAMRQMERRQEWINENQDRRSKELNESMHLQGSPFVASGGAVAPSSFNTSISNEANRLSDVEYGAYNTAKAYNQMLRTTLLQELKEQKQRNENAGWWKDKWNDVSNYFGAMFNTMLDPKLYSQGVMDAAISNNLLQVKKGMEDGTIKKGSNAGNAAQAMLGAIQQQQGEAAKQQQYGTKAYQYGDMNGHSLKFMADFASSGWRNVMTTGFTKAGEKVGEKMALGALGKWFTKNTGRVLGDIAGSAALAATNQLGSTYNNVIERYVGMNNENGGVTQDKNGDLKFNEGVSLGKAIKDGFGSATIENFSEMFGEYLPGAPKLLSKLGLSKVSSFFEKIGNNAYYKWLSNATNKSGIQGVMAEISEEEFGTALHAAWGDGDGSWSDFNVFTNPDAREKQIDTCLGMFYAVGFMQAPRTAVGAINAVQYFNIKHQVAKADKFGQMMFNDKWDEIKSKIDVTTNADLTKTVLDATRSDSMTAKQKGAVINYAMFLSKLRGFNQAADAKTKDKVEEGDTAPTLSNDLDDAYTEGHNADDSDKHNIQLEQNDKANELAAMLHITPEQLHDMADEDLETMTGQDDKLDQAIYDYQVSTAKYQGVMDGAQDEVDMAAHQAAMETDNMTDLSRGTVRKATIKATGGLEDYEVYIISGNIATHDDGSIDVGNSDDMIIYYDPTTGRKEHADAMMFADLIEELPAADVKAQAIIDAKENAIKNIAGIIDGTVEVGSQFSVTDADGTEHTYEVLADNGDGTAMITIDGNIPTELVKGENVQIPYSFADLQQMKDAEDLKRLEAAKAQREQMEKERAAQQNQNTEETQPSFDFNQILNDNGNVVLADVLGKDGNTKYPNSQLFLIRDSGAKAKVMELTSDGSLIPHAVNKKDVRTATTMTLDEYKQAFAESSMIEENSGAIEVEDNEEGKLLYRKNDGAQTEQNQPSTSVTTSQEDAAGSSESKDTNISSNGNENNESLTFEDGTPIPVDVNGEVDLSQTDAAHAAEWYDNNLGEDADEWLDGEIKKAKKVLEQAKNKKLAGTKPSELVASKKEKEAAIADAQAHYDSAISIRDSLKERRIAKVEDTAEGRKELIEKARRKFARLKSAVKDDAEAVSQLYRDTIGSLLHRLYDSTGIDVTDTTPLTAEEYVASNLGAHSLNYEGTETSKGVKQETGLSREDFAKTQLLAADGKGTTIDALVHSLWENRPSNLESLDTQDIRNALIGVLNSGFKASEARNFVENIRIAQAENILEEQKRAQENAAYAEQHKAEPEAELKAKSDEKAELKAKSEEKLDNESSNESNDLGNDLDNEKTNDNINDNINTPEVPEDATDEKPLGEQRTKSPFLVRENGKQQTETESDADIEKNKVDDIKVVDNIVEKKTRKTLEKIAKIMGANIQWLYSNKQFNGRFDEKTNTIYLTLDSSITEGVQFIFGHEMTHEMRTKNPAVYGELKTLVKDMMGEDAFNSETDNMQKRYKKGGARYWNDRNAIEEEVVADQLGIWIRDANYAHTLLLKMSHPLLARLHEIVNSFLMALHGTEFSDDMNLILRSIEQAYVKTAKGEVTNSETGEDVSFSLRQKPEPKKKGVGYKVFVLKDGKLYPPMVANPDGAATPVGVWLDADAAPIAGESKTGRPQVKQGGKGTQGGSGKLAYRPGWHLGVVPYAIQFNRKDAEGNKTLFPKNFVFAEVEYAADVDYQEEARQEGINPSGKYQHSLAGLKHLPTDGYYMYRTNPNPETDPWVITGAMKVNRILTRAEQAELVKNAGREPQQIQEGDIVTDDVVNSINQEIADAPKFSLKDNQGNPLNQDGTLKLDKIKSVDELTDEDFTSAFRNIELPAIPKNVDAAIGANGKPVVIKKNIFEKNWNAHKFTPAESKKVLNDALYNTDLVGHTQPTKKPNHWVAIKLDDKSPITVLEVNDNKDNVEVVGWYTLDERNLGRIKRQAERNGGELIMLTPKDDKVESLSTPPLSSAAKIDNSSETAKENGEKFSLKDEKTMFGMHNISLDKLRKAIKQGGFAAPSMGVIDSKNGIYSGYGEITLIPKAEKIAKRTGKNIGTYAADAWTPIYPPVEKKFGGNGGDVAYDDIESVPKEMQPLTRNAINSFMDGRETNGLAYLYLQEKGKAPELVHVEGKYPKELHDEVKGILGKLNGIYNTTDEQKEKLLDLFIREVYDGNKEEFDNDIKKFIKKDEEFIKKRPNSNIAKNKQLDVDWMKEHGYDYGALSRFVDGILRDAETSGKVDENATMKAAQQYIQDKGMKEDFDSWKEKLNDRYNVEEVIFAGYKPDGNRKYLPNTVENAVKVMKQDGKNASVGSASFSHFVASILKPMGTLDQIRKKKGNLTGNYEDVEKFQEKWQPVYDELADKMQPDAEPFESYGMDRLEEVATQKNPKKYAKEEYGVDLTDEDINKLNELIEAVKNDKPSIYFETKFMRPYGLDEFEKAIVPNDTPSDVVDALKMAGIDVSSYERGNAEDRQKVTMDAINSSDNIRFSLKSMMAKPEGWKQANKKAIHIAEAIERDPKFSLKNLDGTLIKAGTYFSGGGLVEEGLKGIIDPVVAVEYDEKISGVYRNNFGQHIVTADVRDVDPKELVKQIDGEVEYFHASPVCKNYSQAKSNHAEVELDKETAASTAEFINAVKPKVVTIENVKGYKDSESMKTITDALDANGYTWDADVYNAADYGGYTNRERLIVRAVRDGKLPTKPKKMARKSGWYEAVADIIPTLTEKKNGVAPWMDIRLKADGIDWRNIDKPLYVMGSAYADGKVPHAFADELLPTLRTKSGDVIVMPDGKVYRAMGRVLARVSGVSDDYKMPFSENLSHTIIGNGIPTQLTEHVIAPLLQNTLRPTTPEDGNTKFSLRYDKFEHDLNQWKKDNNLPKDAQRPTIPQRNAGESAVDFLRRVDEYRKQMALWKTAPTYEQHLLSDDTALGEFNRELQRGSVLKRIAFQDSMLAIRKAQEAIMKEVGVDRLNMAEDAYTAENRSHGKGKNEFEEYNNEFLQPLRKAYHQMKKVLGDSYDNVRIYMMAKHGLERDAQMAFKKSLEADYEDVAQRSAAYKAYKGDMNRIINDSDLEFGRVDFTTWRQRDNALRVKYSPSYMDYRYDKNGIAYDYSGLSALFDGSDFEEAANKLVKDIESKYVAETHDLWDATNAATKKILRDGYKAGMMSKDTYQYVRDMYSHYIPLRGWDGTTADQVWDYIGGGKGAFNQTLKKAHGRTSIADDPIAYIENMAESGILLNNKNWVKQHLMLLAQNHPTSLLTLSKAWYVKSVDDNGNEEWIPTTPQITSQMDSNQVKAAIDAFEKKMEQMAQAGDATQKRDGLNIAYPQTHSEEREHEVRVMKDGEEYVIYVNGDPQLAQAMNNTRAHRVREIQSGKLDRAAAWLGRKMAAAYTSLSPLFIPSNYFRDLTMTLASTAIREDGRYNYLLRKNLATSWNLGFMLKDYQNGKLREKVSNGNATPKEQMFYDFMMNGGETGFVSSLDVEDLKKKFKNDLKDLDRWKTNPVKVGHTIMDGIEFLNRAIEDSNRFAVYMTSIQYGRSIDEAVNDAKDVTLNFNRKGTGEYGWQMIRNLYLFINPAVQSLQTLGALAKHHPFKFTAVTASWLASGVLVPIVNAALMSLLGGDDDKDKYWQFTKWDRRNNLIMWVPFTHEYIKIPLAQEFRAFYGIGDMIASKMMGGELAEESWSQYAEDLLGQVVDMLPLDPTGYDGNIAVSLMPNAIRPVFELAFNVDFTGKPLFKETEYNKYDPNFTKAYVGTPDWLVRASRMVNSIGNDYPDVQQNSIDAFGDPKYNLNNPAVVDHVLSSYLGGAYTMGSQVLGVLTKSLNDPKEIKVADIPLFSKFVSNPDDRPVTKKQGDEFWNMKENHDRAANTLSKLKKQAKVDGDYSMLERFYGSEEYKQYKQDDVKVKKYEEDKKKERAEESGEEYRPHKLNAEDIYKAHATPKDDFEDLKLKQLYTKLNGFKTSYDLLIDTAPSQSDSYYNTNKAAIDAIDEISLDKQEISELKKGFLDDGKDAYNAEDMKQIRELRKKILSVLEKANRVVVANQKAKAEK